MQIVLNEKLVQEEIPFKTYPAWGFRERHTKTHKCLCLEPHTHITLYYYCCAILSKHTHNQTSRRWGEKNNRDKCKSWHKPIHRIHAARLSRSRDEILEEICFFPIITLAAPKQRNPFNILQISDVESVLRFWLANSNIFKLPVKIRRRVSLSCYCMT